MMMSAQHGTSPGRHAFLERDVMMIKQKHLIAAVLFLFFMILVPFRFQGASPDISSKLIVSIQDGYSDPSPATAGNALREPSGNTSQLPKLISGASGTTWKATTVRTFNKSFLLYGESYTGESREVQARLPRLYEDVSECTNWAVITTIFNATLLAHQLYALHDFCIVVVGDKKSPPIDTWNRAFPNQSSTKRHLVFLDVEAQTLLNYSFSAHIPWNHFGRKNVGYLFAIQHGARIIYDTDDDNILLNDGRYLTNWCTALSGANTEPWTTRLPMENTTHSVYNPNPKFKPVSIASKHPQFVWPRGFPLSKIKSPETLPRETLKSTTNSDSFAQASDIAVVQSIAHYDPDVDAIYRLTQPVPLSFEVEESDEICTVVPPGTLSPFNAQATLFARDAFWALLLPTTVHGRVSDIWRSYIGSRLFWDIGMKVAFAKPFVAQYRNAHNYLADFNGEKHLYEQADGLTQFLIDWSSSRTTLEGRLEDLIVTLYEIGILEIDDVWLTQRWIADLLSIGYRFPKLRQQFHRPEERDADANVVDDTNMNMTVELDAEEEMMSAPEPNKRLFCGRLPVEMRSKSFILNGGYFKSGNNLINFDVSTSVGPAEARTKCAQQCASDQQCQMWSFVSKNGTFTCSLKSVPVQNPDRDIPYIVINDDAATGSPENRRFVLWTSPLTLARHKRTLLVVNWHWPTTNLLIAEWMTMHAFRLPEDVDVVHVGPWAFSANDPTLTQTWAMSNPWTNKGYFSYMSTSIAANALPGYRGYMLTNDDAFIRWDLVKLEASPKVLWSPIPEVLPISSPKVQGKTWYWFSMVFSTDEMTRDCPYFEKQAQACRIYAVEREEFTTIWWGQADFYYVPSSMITGYAERAARFVVKGVFLEIAVPTIFSRLCALRDRACEASRCESCWKIITYATEWDARRGNPDQFTSVNTSAVVHPTKFTTVKLKHWLLTKFSGLPW